MTWWGSLRRDGTPFQPITQRSRLAAVSGTLLVVALAGLILGGIDRHADFTGGGTAVEAENVAGLTLGEFRGALGESGFGGVRVQRTDNGAGFLVLAGVLDEAERDSLVTSVATAAGVDAGSVSAETTGPAVDWDPLRTLLVAVGLLAAASLLVAGWRIGLKAAVTAVTVLTYVVVVTLGLYNLTGLEMGPATVAALVGIAAYAVYHAVVVLDRVREVNAELGSRFDFEYIANLSFNRVLPPSLVTAAMVALPTLVALGFTASRPGTAPLVSVLVVVLLGVLVSGYAAPCLGIPVLGMWPQPLPGPRRRGHSRRSRRREFRPATIVDEGEDTGAVARPPRKTPRR